MDEKPVSLQTLQRMPTYLNFLRSLSDQNGNISSRAIAEALRLGEIQVRKDLAAVSGEGKPKVGYPVGALIGDIERFLGCDSANDAVLVGAGKLGRALLGYEGFLKYGVNIVAAFDSDETLWGTDESGKQIFPMERLGELCRRMGIRIGVITVPAPHAQEVCDQLVESGILAIWNFAPAHLCAPEHILIKSENMAASMALLSKHLQSAMHEQIYLEEKNTGGELHE